jgi:putative spermidine/putrescine transport system permease protein
MGTMIGMSFLDAQTQSPTLFHYQRFFTDGLSLAGLYRTALMSILVAICVTVLGYPVAYYLARSRSRWRALVFALALAPELAGVVLRTYGWLIILEDRGFINDMLMNFGLIASPLPLSKNLFAVVVGLTHVVLPFGILSLTTSIQGIDPNLERAAQMLGASRLAVVRHIILPLSVPGIVSSLLIAFTMAASAYATPALLGGARFKVLATMIYEQVLVLYRLGFRRRHGDRAADHDARHLLPRHSLRDTPKRPKKQPGRRCVMNRALTCAFWLAIALVLTFITLPLAVVVAASLSPSSAVTFLPWEWTFDWYGDLLADRWLQPFLAERQDRHRCRWYQRCARRSRGLRRRL